jgi:hypothetical protein
MWVSVIFTSAAFSMEFANVTLRDGTNALRATGPIVAGDAKRFKEALSSLKPDRKGMRLVFLSSPGGSVSEALDIAEIINRQDKKNNDPEIQTIVAWGDVCISACASIVFLSGNARVLAGDGILKFHACSGPDAKKAHKECNEGLPKEMMGAGVAHGDLAMLLMDPAVDNFISLDQVRATCGGLVRWPHERRGIRLSPCAQATYFKKLVDDIDFPLDLHPLNLAMIYENTPGMPVPAGIRPMQFAYTWLPEGRWGLTQIEDGLRAYKRQRQSDKTLVEISFSCNEDDPGKTYFSYRIVGTKKKPAERFKIVISQQETLFHRQDSNVRVFEEPNEVEYVVLLGADVTPRLVSSQAIMSFELLNQSGQTMQSQQIPLKQASPFIKEAFYNCVGRLRTK